MKNEASPWVAGHPPDERRAIEQLNADWIAAMNAKDIRQLTDMVTEDVVFLPPGLPPIRGRRAVEAMYASFFSQFRTIEQASTIEELDVVGDWAFMWGTESLTLGPVGGGPAIRLEGKGMTILKRQDDGAWKFARGINNSVAAPTRQ